MARFVCDFDQVRSTAKKLIDEATKLEGDSINYHNNMSNSLSGWNGSAKSSFISTVDVKAEEALEKAKFAISFGEYMNNAVNAIEQVEEQLGSLSI